MLDIVYRDETCIVINKPAGMLVHRTYLDHGETVFAVQQLRDQIGMKVHPVHRLDKPTSGLLMFALNAEALTTLQSQFTKKSVKKVYWAIVRGYLSGNGSLDYPLKREVDSYSQAATAVNQSAVTHYRCLAQTELPVPVGRYPTTRYSWIELKPETGRKHQLRRHLAHLRHPIVGDTRHGDGAHNRFFREHLGIYRLLLHAQKLSFKHPVSGNRITLTAHLDEAFLDALKKTDLDRTELKIDKV
jgi:tRNA pseudouridine65 synthase